MGFLPGDSFEQKPCEQPTRPTVPAPDYFHATLTNKDYARGWCHQLLHAEDVRLSLSPGTTITVLTISCGLSITHVATPMHNRRPDEHICSPDTLIHVA